jgi:hypothetical protein
MKLLNVRRVKNSSQLIDENENLVGERFCGFLAGTNERLKVNNNFYRVKYSGFLWNKLSFLDHRGKVIVMIDGERNRIFYYGKCFTEIYDIKSNGWSKGSTSLYQFENDELVMRFDSKWSLFKSKYEVHVREGFNNLVLALAFLHYNIKNMED